MKPPWTRICALVLLLTTAFLSVRGQVPSIIHFQGRLARAEQEFSGIGEFKFSLVNSNGSETFWSNDGTGQGGAEPSNATPVLVHKGLFSVSLGEATLPHMTPVSPLVFTNGDVRLRTWFREAQGQTRHDLDADVPRHDGDNKEVAQRRSNIFELLAPDQRIAAVGYAMFAANVPDGSITSAKLSPGAVDQGALAPASVGTQQLANGAVTREKLAPDAILPGEVGDSSIGTRQLVDGAVTTSKLPNNAVTGPKLAPGAVGPSQLADQGVTQDKLAPLSVGTAQLAPGSVGSNQLAAGAALANLKSSGQSGIGLGGIILSLDPNAPALTQLGFIRAGSLALAPERWETRTGPAPLVAYPEIAVWTGTELIAAITSDGQGFSGARYDPRAITSLWRPISSVGAPTNHGFMSSVWTGTEMILWGGYSRTTGGGMRDGYVYNPTTDRWRPMTGNGAPTGRQAPSVAWTGSEMLVWGGVSFDTRVPLNDGGRYSPVRNEWRPLSTSNSPAARFNHSTIWTGKEMIVWGGQIGFVPRSVLNSGGRYQPSNDAWTDTTIIGAPPGASESSAIWTGTEMIVWGGGTSNYSPVRTGGRFNPENNSWRAVPITTAPMGRAAHSAVWTGTEMIIWGGTRPGSNDTTASGGRFNPATEEWFSTTTDAAPLGLHGHQAFWLGDGMLIVGGSGAGNSDGTILPFWRPAMTTYLYELR